MRYKQKDRVWSVSISWDMLFKLRNGVYTVPDGSHNVEDWKGDEQDLANNP